MPQPRPATSARTADRRAAPPPQTRTRTTGRRTNEPKRTRTNRSHGRELDVRLYRQRGRCLDRLLGGARDLGSAGHRPAAGGQQARGTSRRRRDADLATQGGAGSSGRGSTSAARTTRRAARAAGGGPRRLGMCWPTVRRPRMPGQAWERAGSWGARSPSGWPSPTSGVCAPRRRSCPRSSTRPGPAPICARRPWTPRARAGCGWPGSTRSGASRCAARRAARCCPIPGTPNPYNSFGMRGCSRSGWHCSGRYGRTTRRPAGRCSPRRGRRSGPRTG